MATPGGTGTFYFPPRATRRHQAALNCDPGRRRIGETSDGRTLAMWFSAGGRDSRRLATRQIAHPGPPWLGWWSPAVAYRVWWSPAVRPLRPAGGHASCGHGFYRRGL